MRKPERECRQELEAYVSAITSFPRFHALAVIRFRDAVIAVTLNEVFLLLAFVTPPAEWQNALDFTDCPKRAALFEQFGIYTLLPADALSQLLTREMRRELARHEQKQIRYFRPRRVGDVIFNCWD